MPGNAVRPDPSELALACDSNLGAWQHAVIDIAFCAGEHGFEPFAINADVFGLIRYGHVDEHLDTSRVREG